MRTRLTILGLLVVAGVGIEALPEPIEVDRRGGRERSAASSSSMTGAAAPLQSRDWQLWDRAAVSAPAVEASPEQAPPATVAQAGIWATPAEFAPPD
jgi:hypothetical protein